MEKTTAKERATYKIFSQSTLLENYNLSLSSNLLHTNYVE